MALRVIRVQVGVVIVECLGLDLAGVGLDSEVARALPDSRRDKHVVNQFVHHFPLEWIEEVRRMSSSQRIRSHSVPEVCVWLKQRARHLVNYVVDQELLFHQIVGKTIVEITHYQNGRKGVGQFELLAKEFAYAPDLE